MYDPRHLRSIQLASRVCNKPPARQEIREELNRRWGTYCTVGPRGGFREKLYTGRAAAQNASRELGGKFVLVRAAYAESAEDDARPRFEALFPDNEELVGRLMWLHGRTAQVPY